ncbi:MAG: cell division protein FtsZ [Armatimonadetes bacterium]|nr:cell division protein FtsZ [Armatimonadota bacterium]MDW8121427.1 cell division protein FtsZ [Armatimonadota bacterium]
MPPGAQGSEGRKVVDTNPVDIRVIGVGGAGNNSINRLAEMGVRGVELIAINTDSQVLSLSRAHKTLQIGVRLTGGRGAGGNPQIGRQAAEEDRQQIASLLDGAEMVFITAGGSGGTGSGAAPVVAQIAKEKGILTVGVITKPFWFEYRKMDIAQKAIEEMKAIVDALIVIPNDRLFEMADRKLTMPEAFRKADEVLAQAVRGITDIILRPGEINVDFADVKAVLEKAGTALFGLGSATGDKRATEAAQAAITSPLLESSISGAKRVLFCITSSRDVRVEELKEAAAVITGAIDSSEAIVTWGLIYDDNLDQEIQITLIAAGFGEQRDRPPAERGTWDRRPIRTGADNQKEKGTQAMEELLEKDLEIPAFLRRAKES